MKKLLILLICIFMLSCASRHFYIQHSNPQKPSMKHYNEIHLGWVPLAENDWIKHGYEKKQEWLDVIEILNTEALPTYLREFLRDKIFIAAKGPGNAIPDKGDLFIKFNRYESTAKYQESCVVDVEFIDIRTKKTIFTATADIYKGRSEHRDFAFTGRFWTLFYWIDNFLYYQLKD